MAKNLVTIGETTALIPEAGSAVREEWILDGQSGNTNYPYAEFKALATVGEVDSVTGEALTGYPDGNAAWLHDDDTVRVAYQSESYGRLGWSPNPETWTQELETGATFTGSKVHYIDYDRESFADFMVSGEPASDMVKGSGLLFNRAFNMFGEEVKPKNDDPSDLGAKWGNETLASGHVMPFLRPLTDADYYFHSFCGAWYEPANRHGEGVGFEDDVWLTAEEWDIGFAFAPGAAGDGIANATMGLAPTVTDINNGILYTAPALGQTGYEKMMPINPEVEEFQVMVMAGYNHGQEPAPLKIFVGRKGYDAEGNEITDEHSERDQFLGRNGLLYGKLYGQAISKKTARTLDVDLDANGNGVYDDHAMDAYLTNADAPDNFKGRFLPTSYQWGGWDEPTAVQDTEMFLWERPEEQHGKFKFFNGDSKAEHVAGDPGGSASWFQNMTDEGALMGFKIKKIGKQLQRTLDDGEMLPDFLKYKAVRTVAAVDGALTIETGGEGLAHVGSKNPDGTLDASTHVEKGVSKMVAPDGLHWVKGPGGNDVLIVDEDSGNDYGERKYALPIDKKTLTLRDEATGYHLAVAGGKLNPRQLAGAAALPGTSWEIDGVTNYGQGAEFSGSWDVTAITARKEDGSFYTKEELSGTGLDAIQNAIPIEDHLYQGVVQYRGESAGQVEEVGGDAGGQLFQYTMSDFF